MLLFTFPTNRSKSVLDLQGFLADHIPCDSGSFTSTKSVSPMIPQGSCRRFHSSGPKGALLSAKSALLLPSVDPRRSGRFRASRPDDGGVLLQSFCFSRQAYAHLGWLVLVLSSFVHKARSLPIRWECTYF